MRGVDWWREITWGSLTMRGDSRGCPPWVHFFRVDPKSWREWVIGPRNPWLRWNSAERPHSMLDAVIIMDCRGLVDPRNKPFGNVLPLEVQVKIMFWVECFYTMDKRKKVVRELRGLPICSMTGYPKHLGEDRWWNQVIVRLHAPRTNGKKHS